MNKANERPNFYFSDKTDLTYSESKLSNDIFISEKKYLKKEKKNIQYFLVEVPSDGLCGFYCLGLDAGAAIEKLISKVENIINKEKELKITEISDPIIKNIAADIRNTISIAYAKNVSANNQPFEKRLKLVDREIYKENYELYSALVLNTKGNNIDIKKSILETKNSIFNIYIESIFFKYLTHFMIALRKNGLNWLSCY